MANIQGKCCLLVTCQVQFTPCKHGTQVNCLCRFSQCLLDSKSLECAFWNSQWFLFPPPPISFDSGLSQVITDLSWNLPRECSGNPRLADVLPLLTGTLASPFPVEGLWIHSAVGQQIGESQAGGGWQSQGELWFPLHKVPVFVVVTWGGSRCHVWLWCDSVVMLLHFDLSADHNRANREPNLLA